VAAEVVAFVFVKERLCSAAAAPFVSHTRGQSLGRARARNSPSSDDHENGSADGENQAATERQAAAQLRRHSKAIVIAWLAGRPTPATSLFIFVAVAVVQTIQCERAPVLADCPARPVRQQPCRRRYRALFWPPHLS
jgi:hypothetical protein